MRTIEPIMTRPPGHEYDLMKRAEREMHRDQSEEASTLKPVTRKVAKKTTKK